MFYLLKFRLILKPDRKKMNKFKLLVRKEKIEQMKKFKRKNKKIKRLDKVFIIKKIGNLN
jgi:hypothetical protein